MKEDEKKLEQEEKPVGGAAEETAEKAAESAALTTGETAPKSEEKPVSSEAGAAEDVSAEGEQTADDPSEELEVLKAENTRLKAQLEAHGAGFKPEYIEDAVLIADNAARRDGITIQEALQAVAKKYPDWKHAPGDSTKGGFKVGAQAHDEDNAAADDSLDEAFGIRRKK